MESLNYLIFSTLERCLSERGLILDEKSINSIIRDVKVWLKPSVEGEGIKATQDGSLTLISDKYGEPYHSLTSGAIRECLLKFIEPSQVVKKAQKGKVRIIDVGFGLGYNLAIALERIKRANPYAEVQILSFEKELPEIIPLLPEPYKGYQKLLLDGLPEFCKDGISFRLLLGDARKTIKQVSEFIADAVFHDGFSPYRNPELWTYEFLREIRLRVSLEGIWVSYTSSLAVRKALKMLGFGIATSQSVGRKKGGTVASLTLRDLLSTAELKKLSTSPYAIPFRDETLKAQPLEILINYRVNVELLKVAQGGIEPPTPRFSAGCSTN